jgi:uncharacterized DUF497 family protein
VNTFECDKTKAKSNYKKHTLRFTEGCRIFSGHTLTAQSNQNDDLSEERYLSIGALDDDTTVVVVWVQRARNIRVISVRKARKNERENYYAHIKRTVN